MSDKSCKVCEKELPSKIELALHYENDHGGLDNAVKLDYKNQLFKRREIQKVISVTIFFVKLFIVMLIPGM